MGRYSPLLFAREVLADMQIQLMELGITPIVTSGMIIQMLAGSQLIDVNLDLKSDRELFQTAQKCSYTFLARMF